MKKNWLLLAVCACALTLVPVTASRAANHSELNAMKTAYLNSVKKFKTANGFGDLLGCYSKNGIAQLQRGLPEGPAEEGKNLQLLRMMLPSDPKITDASARGRKGTITAEGNSSLIGEATGTITMVKDRGVWKVDSEKWARKGAAGK